MENYIKEKKLSSIEMGSVILYGRLILDNKEKSEKKKNIKDILTTIINPDFNINELLGKGGKKHLIQGFKWRFAGVKIGSYQKDEYIYGKLGKESSQVQLAFDETKKDYIESERTKANVMHFLIDLNKKVLAYEYKKDIGDKTPIELLRELIRLFYNGDISLDIKMITDKRLITDRMKRFSILNRIDLNVCRTNPDSTSGSDKMDTFLREGRIKKLLMRAIGDEGGIRLDKTDLIKSGIHLAEEGYGSAQAIGEIGKRKEKLSFGDIPMRSEVNLIKDDNMNLQTLLFQIKEILRRLDIQSNNKKR